MRSIRSGTYEVRIDVRDLLAGTAAERVMRFAKE